MKPQDIYVTSRVHEGEGITGQPVFQRYYHRSFQEIFSHCFESGFIITGFFEETDDDDENPIATIIRLRKG